MIDQYGRDLGPFPNCQSEEDENNDKSTKMWAEEDTQVLRKIILRKTNATTITLREKCPNTEFFLVRKFLDSDWIFSPNPGKYGSEKTPYQYLSVFSPYAGKIRTRKNSIFGYFSRSVILLILLQHLISLFFILAEGLFPLSIDFNQIYNNVTFMNFCGLC